MLYGGLTDFIQLIVDISWLFKPIPYSVKLTQLEVLPTVVDVLPLRVNQILFQVIFCIMLADQWRPLKIRYSLFHAGSCVKNIISSTCW